MIRDVWGLKINKYGEIWVMSDSIMMYTMSEKKMQMYGDVNKKVKENECVYKIKKYRHKI